MYNIANVGWQLVHYTVYGTKKSNNDAFLRPVNCMVDSPASNICIVWPCSAYIPMDGNGRPCRAHIGGCGKEGYYI